MEVVSVKKLPYFIFKRIIKNPGISKEKKKQLMNERYFQDKYNFRCL
tara:strand:- start:270 stop:410 length:141 start_codon:yes stop_codon:yes gene_type:complete